MLKKTYLKKIIVFMGINEAVNHVGLKGGGRQKSPYKLLSLCLISFL